MLRLIVLMIVVGLPVTAARAAGPAAFLISDVREHEDGGSLLIEVTVLNDDAERQSIPLPDKMEARIDSSGQASTIWLERVEHVPDRIALPPGGFARVVYVLRPLNESDPADAAISIPAWGTRQVAMRTTGVHSAQSGQVSPAPPPVPNHEPSARARSSADRSPSNAFLGNLSAYEPVYVVYGPGTNTEARVQFSFKYQLFGTRHTDRRLQSGRDGLHFAYTQRMFWDLGARSSPFRNIDFQPEIFYLTPVETLPNKVSLSAQGGAHHELNGRGGADLRSFNTLYVAPMATVSLGDGYNLSVAPRLAVYIGDLSDNPDIQRYRGNLSFAVEIGKDDGWQLSTNTRYNFSSGKGAISADLSYPLQKMLGGGPNFYLFGQSFFGYGENLLDYAQLVTRIRVGLAIVR